MVVKGPAHLASAPGNVHLDVAGVLILRQACLELVDLACLEIDVGLVSLVVTHDLRHMRRKYPCAIPHELLRQVLILRPRLLGLPFIICPPLSLLLHYALTPLQSLHRDRHESPQAFLPRSTIED